MQEVLVRDHEGTRYNSTTMKRALKAEAKNNGRIMNDSWGKTWLVLNNVPNPCHSTPPPTELTNAKRRRRRIARIRERDGDHCFYCLRVMSREQMTIEHLLPQKLKGSDSLQNLVLAHARCNELAGHLSIAEKVRLREQHLAERLRFLTPKERRKVLGNLNIPPLPLPTQ